MKKVLCLLFMFGFSYLQADIVRNADQVLNAIFIAKDTTTAIPPSIRVTLSSNTISFHITGSSVALNNWYVLMNDNLKLSQSTDIAKLNRDITINISTNILKLNNDLTTNNSTNFIFLESDNLKLAQSTDIARLNLDLYNYLFGVSRSTDISKLNIDILSALLGVSRSTDIAKFNTDLLSALFGISRSTDIAGLRLDLYGVARSTNIDSLILSNYGMARSSDIVNLGDRITVNNSTNSAVLNTSISTNIVNAADRVTVNNSTNSIFISDTITINNSTNTIRQNLLIVDISTNIQKADINITGMRNDLYGIIRSSTGEIMEKYLLNIDGKTILTNTKDIAITTGTVTITNTDFVTYVNTVTVVNFTSTVTVTNENLNVTATNFTSTITLTNSNLNVTLQNTTMTFTNQSISDSRYYNKVSTGTAGLITGVTSASIVIADNVSHWSFKCKNEINSDYFRIDNTLIGYQCELSDGDMDNESVIIPTPITFTLTNLGIGTTVQYIIMQIK